MNAEVSATADAVLDKFNGNFQCNVLPDPDDNTGRDGTEILFKNRRWPKGQVFYKFAHDSTDRDKQIILSAMEEISSQTCITFHQLPNQENNNDQKNFIQFKHEPGGCYSPVGMTGGAQPLNLEKPGCMYQFIIVHEIMHALGFIHEHQRHDRDEHVEIHWDNINEGWEFQYTKIQQTEFAKYGPYDLNSLMHYKETAYAKQGRITMRAIRDPFLELGNTIGLSALDVKKLQEMYGCE